MGDEGEEKNPKKICEEEMKGEFSWTIETKSINIERRLVSSIFKIRNLPDFEFTINVSKHDEPSKWGRRMWITLNKIPSRLLDCKLTMSMTNIDRPHGNSRHSWTYLPWTTQHVTIPSDLFITIKFEITWYRSTHAHLVYPSPNLYEDLQPFLLQSSLSDVKIIIGEEELPAHKLILGAHSSVFKTMFESDMKEARKNEVVITDITADVLRNVLSVLYTGCDKSLDDSEMALKVLFVAEKYDMKKLKHCCEFKLYKQLTTSNVLEFLDSSDIHNAECLREECFKFMIDNKNTVLDTSEFENLCLRKPKLMYTFMRAAINY